MLAIIFGLIIALVHYISENFYVKFSSPRITVMSFSAGITLAYILLHLLPNLYSVVIHFRALAFIFVLYGFTVLHIIEKHIYKHPSKRRRKEELEGVHSIAFFTYYFVVGIVLAVLTRTNSFEGVLFFIPLLLHTAISRLSLKEVHKDIRGMKGVKLLLAGSTLFGVVLTFLIVITPLVYHILLGFVIGALLYIAIRDLMPTEGGGEPPSFTIGVISYSVIIGLTWIV